jgi:hypothetical protein
MIGTLATINNNGKIMSSNSSSTPFTPGKVWGGTGTVEYFLATGGQTVVAGTYNNLTLSNTSGTQTGGGALTVNGALSTSSGGTLNLATYALSGTLTAINNNGTITTQCLSNPPIQNGKTWNGTVTYNAATGAQTISNGTYATLLMTNTSGTQSLNGNTTISSAMNTAGGKLAIGSNTLTINGTISGLTASGSLVANGSSNISIGGSGALGSSLFFDQSASGTSNRLNDLTYNRASQTITLGNALQVSGTVTPTAGTLATGNVLTLVSNAANTARIAAGSGTYITGNVTAERYIPSVARRWRFLASPVTGATLDDWQNEIFITGTGGAANGFDATLSNAAGVYSYNESVAGEFNANGWVAPSNINEVLTPGKGFRVFIRGDRSDAGVLAGTTGTQAAVTMNAIGAANTGNITMPVTYTNSGSNVNDGWSFVGNPYPSAIDWNAFHDAGRAGSSPDYSGTDYTHLDAVASFYDVNIANYASYNAVSNIGTGAFSGGVIPSGASFWVKASAASPSMTMKEQYKTAATPGMMFKTDAPEATFLLRLSKDAITSDDILVKYIKEASDNFDLYDIAKLNGEVNISSIAADGTLLTGNCKPFNGVSDSIRLNIGVAKSGTYSFTVSNAKLLAPGYNIYLVDAFTHTSFDLNQQQHYSFSIDMNDAATYGKNRFMIVVGELPVTQTGIAEQNDENTLSVYPSLTRGEVTISSRLAATEAVSVTITDATGKLVAAFDQLQWNGNKMRLDLSDYKAGAYFIRVKDAKHNAVLKCIKYE